MWIVNHRKLFYTFSAILVIVSVVSLIAWGLVPGLDFTGGTLVDITYSNRPDQASIVAALTPIDPAVSVRPSGDEGFIVRMKDVDQPTKARVLSAITVGGTASSTINTFDAIGPILGAEALRKAIISIILVILAIVLYITFAFRKVSEPVSSWKYGLVAIVALLHDIIIPTGAFAILGHYFGYEVDTLFVTALLVVLGFSVHDTIVVFDRVRENLLHGSSKDFAGTVGKSISQTFTRSINTSLTVLLSLIILFILGGSSTQHFVLALIIGIAAGTYSSVFLGSPLLVTLEKWSKKK